MMTAPDNAKTSPARWTQLLNEVRQLISRAHSPQWCSPSLARSPWVASFDAAETATK
jgi:hypothetical protein